MQKWMIWQYISAILFFYSRGDIQRWHRKWVKAIYSVCLPLIFPLIYSSVSVVPPLRSDVTHTSLLLCLRGWCLQPERLCQSWPIHHLADYALTGNSLAISISMTKYIFYVSGFQPHRSKCYSGSLFLTLEITDIVRVVFIALFLSNCWTDRSLPLKNVLYALVVRALLWLD